MSSASTSGAHVVNIRLHTSVALRQQQLYGLFIHKIVTEFQLNNPGPLKPRPMQHSGRSSLARGRCCACRFSDRPGVPGPWKVGGEPGSKIRTVSAIFGVEAGSFLRANPDGFAEQVPLGRCQSPDGGGSRGEWPDPESGRWLDLGFRKWTPDYVSRR